MSHEVGEPTGDPEIDKLLEDCLVAAVTQETTGLEWDLGNIACQRAVLEALNLEGVDVGYLTNTLNLRPDSSADKMTRGYKAAVDLLRSSITMPANSKDYWIALFEKQHRIAKVLEKVVWARRNIDDGVDPNEAKVVTQLDIYIDRTLPGDEKDIWLKVVDRIIPEVVGLDPASPETALEIEAWLTENQ